MVEEKREYAPDFPEVLKILSWLTLVACIITFVFLTYGTITAEPDAVMYNQYGLKCLAGTGVHRLLGYIVGLMMISVGAMIAISVLRVRMWAYYLFLAGFAGSVVSRILDLMHHHQVGIFDLPMNIIWFVLVLSGYKQYRTLADYRRRHPQITEWKS